MHDTDFSRLTLKDVNEILTGIGDGGSSEPLSLRNALLIEEMRADASRLQALAEGLHATLARIDAVRGELADKLSPVSEAADCSVLSQRQLEILTWVAQGKSNTVIVTILGISAHTVDTHLRRTFERLETSDRTVAAIRAVQNGWIPAAA